MKFAIGIPTLNRLDLLFPSLIFYGRDMPNVSIFVLDNGNQQISKKMKLREKICLIEQKSNIGVAASWNVLCKEIYKTYDNALMLNDDIYLGRTDSEIDMLITAYGSRGMIKASCGWDSFLLPKKTFENPPKPIIYNI